MNNVTGTLVVTHTRIIVNIWMSLWFSSSGDCTPSRESYAMKGRFWSKYVFYLHIQD